MKNYIVIGIVVLLAIGLLFAFGRKKRPSLVNILNKQTATGESKKIEDSFKDVKDLCTVMTKEKISSLLGKSIVKTQTFTRTNSYTCEYYLSDKDFVGLHLEYMSVENQKKGLEFLGYKITTDPKVSIDHFLAIQENGKINGSYLILRPDEYIRISRSSVQALTEEETINFMVKVADLLRENVPFTRPNAEEKKEVVPLPQETDIIRSFFSLIGEKKPADAVGMMNVNNDSEKQAWAVQFNAIMSMNISSIEPSMQEEWTETKHTYKVTMDVKMNPDSANAPIPYYGWDNGKNIRWITLEKIGNLWKVNGIATGP